MARSVKKGPFADASLLKKVDAMNAAAPSWLLVVIVLGTLLIAAFSAWVGCRMLKKQFEKAGITR